VVAVADRVEGVSQPPFVPDVLAPLGRRRRRLNGNHYPASSRFPHRPAPSDVVVGRRPGSVAEDGAGGEGRDALRHSALRPQLPRARQVPVARQLRTGLRQPGGSASRLPVRDVSQKTAWRAGFQGSLPAI
jgi:hypothetical protein